MHVTGKVMSVIGSLVVSEVQHNNCSTEKRCKVLSSEWSYSSFIRAKILHLKTTKHCKTIFPAARRGKGRGASCVLLPQKFLTQMYGFSWE